MHNGKDTKDITTLFVVVQFVAVNSWKQTKYISVADWLNKLCFIHTMEFFTAAKRSEELFQYTSLG